MFRPTLLIISFLLSLSLVAQKNIESARGYDKIVVGMSVSSLVNAEPTYTKMNFNQEKAEWIDHGYTWDEELVRQIPFDESYTFTQGNKYGIWTVYVKDKKVVIIQISKNYFPVSLSAYPSIDGKINFGASIEDIEKVYGTNYIRQVAYNGTISMTYPELGISFNVWEFDGLTTLYVFEKMNEPDAKSARQKMQKLTPAEN